MKEFLTALDLLELVLPQLTIFSHHSFQRVTVDH